jgi:hypothetical protein
MTHEEFKEKALEMVQYERKETMRLMQSYSSHETIENETYEKHLAIFYDKYTMMYILVAKTWSADPVSLIYTSYVSALKNYHLLKQ